MFGGLNFQHESVRYMNGQCLEAGPPGPVKPSDDSSSPAFEFSAEAPDIMEISCPHYALSEFLTHRNNGIISHYCCFPPLSCRLII